MIDRTPHYNSIFNVLDRESLTPILHELITRAALPLKGLETDFAVDYPRAERGFEKLVERELERMLAEIPAQDLAIQWNCAYETQDIEGVLAWTSEGG